MYESIHARFDSREPLGEVLYEMRRSGATHHVGTVPMPAGGAFELRLSVREENASLARAIIRRSGGVIVGQ